MWCFRQCCGVEELRAVLWCEQDEVRCGVVVLRVAMWCERDMAGRGREKYMKKEREKGKRSAVK